MTILLSAHNPMTGARHLGHYVSTMRDWPELEKQHTCYFVIDDLIAYLMYPSERKEIFERSLLVAQEYIASGINLKKSRIIFTSTIADLFEAITLSSYFVDAEYLARLHEHSFMGILAPHQRSQLKARRSPSVAELLYPQLAMPVLSLFLDTDYFQGGLEISGYVHIMKEISRDINSDLGLKMKVPEWLEGKTIYLRGTDGNHMTNENGYLLSTKEKNLSGSNQYGNSPLRLKSLEQVPKDILVEWAEALDYKKFQTLETFDNRNAFIDFETMLDKELKRFREFSMKSNDILDVITDGANAVRPIIRNNIDRLKDAMSIPIILDEGY